MTSYGAHIEPLDFIPRNYAEGVETCRTHLLTIHELPQNHPFTVEGYDGPYASWARSLAHHAEQLNRMGIFAPPSSASA